MFLSEGLFAAVTAASRSVDPGGAYLVETFVLVGLVFFWCKFDAQERNASLPRWNRVLIVVIAIIGVPIYFFRTRSTRDAIFATLKSLGVLVGLAVVSAVGTFAGHALAT
jgi:hypothetical protein